MEFKVVEVELKRTVCGLMNETTDLVDHRRLPVAGKSHHLVLVLVDREAEIGRERRIQHAERVRKPDFTQQRDLGSAIRTAHAVTNSERCHSPTPSAVRIAARSVGAVRNAAAACEW